MKRILFVDDEPQVLDGLRTRLRRMRVAWHMEFAGSGRDAIALLERSAFDVIVTDQRMPEMDGATLLQIVLARWPRTIRIVLSGYAEVEQTMRLVPVAHQYISKPCDPAQLENAIGRCVGLQELLGSPVLREVVGRWGPLPPAPATYAKLQAAMNDESCSVSQIADLVAGDTIVTAKVLQLVNSSFFRVPRRITTVEQAVGYLGLNTVRNLVISADVFSKWPVRLAEMPLSLESLQGHASQVATIVALLVRDPQKSNDAQLAALLHDIGYLLLSHSCAEELRAAVQLAVTESLPMDEAERRVLGASHAEVGAYLLGIWGFPSSIVEAVAHHHSTHRVAQTDFDTLALLSVAHALAEGAENHAFHDSRLGYSEVAAEYLEGVHAPFAWEEAKARVSAVFPTGVQTP